MLERHFYKRMTYMHICVCVVTAVVILTGTHLINFNSQKRIEELPGFKIPQSIQEPKTRLINPNLLLGGYYKSTASDKVPAKGDGVSNIVVFVWCGGGRKFEFKHMLAVLSALKIQQPQRVILYHWRSTQPREDLYNEWLTELKTTFHNFDVIRMPIDVPMPKRCGDGSQRAKYLSRLYKKYSEGMIYLNENVILRKPVDEYRTMFTVSNNVPGVLIGRNFTRSELLRSTSLKSCPTYTKVMDNDVCINMDFSKLFPKDIMESDGKFFELARQLFYGSSEKKLPNHDLSDPIPNIGHFYLTGQGTISFFTYLGIYSMLSVLNLDMVYIHGDVEPKGDYWQKLNNTNKITLVFSPRVKSIFGNKVEAPAHSKDISSAHILYVYGGFFIDWDAVFTKPLDDYMRGYDMIMAYDHILPPEGKSYPECLNPGVMAAKRHSKFLLLWLEKYRNFGTKGGYYTTGLLMPYKVYEYYPETIKLDRHFQVMCLNSTCHPTWRKGFGDITLHLDFDWRTVNSVHFTYPDPGEYLNERVLRKSTNWIGKMGQDIMGWN